MFKKVVREILVFGKVCASKTWSFSSTCKNLKSQHPLGAEIWFFEKSALSGYNLTFRSPLLLNQCSPVFFRLTREESLQIRHLSDFEYLYPLRRYSPSNFEVVRNRAKFCMFLAP